MRPLRLIWVYPDLLSTYGDRGNLLVLERRARLRGIPVEVVEVNSDQPVPRDGDIYLMGGGEDLPQTLATRRLLADGGLHAAAERGVAVFAVWGSSSAAPTTRRCRVSACSTSAAAGARAGPSARSSQTWTRG
jgi:CobQ-like glutamine amidotransferase family enzyme